MGSRGRTVAQLRAALPAPAQLMALPDPIAGAQTIDDLRRLGRRKVPRAVFDYVDGAAEDEIGLAEARAAWRGVRFHPHTLEGAAAPDPSTTLLGLPAGLPLVLAPVGYLGLVHGGAERAAAAAAARAGVPFTVATLGTTRLTDVVASEPTGRTWFQLYLSRDEDLNDHLLADAAAAGVDTLVLTCDSAVSGSRLRDRRNGLTLPPRLTRRTLLGMASRPAWAARILREPFSYPNLDPYARKTDAYGRAFAAPLSREDVERVREKWAGRLVVKGIARADDAECAVNRGVDAVVLSNHGGRQLDRVPPPLLLLPEVLERVGGRAEVYVDSGITKGADIVAAVAAGATGVLVGRAYAFGLMAGGEAGVDRALAILREDVVRTMALLGASTIDDLSPDLVTLPTA